MCVLCYGLAGEEHWTDAYPGMGSGGELRARRQRLLAVVLAAHGLECYDDPSGLTSVVSDRKGNVRVVRGLGELWAAAEQVSGRRLDPLDPALLHRLNEVR